MTSPVSGDRPGGAGVEPERRTVSYPGGLAARYRWVGSGAEAALSATSEAGGEMHQFGPLVSGDTTRMCAAELRVEGPIGTWTARFASPIHDEPQGLVWDSAGLLVVKYGFALYALAGRTGELRWHHATRTPLLSVLASSRLSHVLAQSELETSALREDGEVAWRIAHADVITQAELVGGRLVLTTYGGAVIPFDPRTGERL